MVCMSLRQKLYLKKMRIRMSIKAYLNSVHFHVVLLTESVQLLLQLLCTAIECRGLQLIKVYNSTKLQLHQTMNLLLQIFNLNEEEKLSENFIRFDVLHTNHSSQS